LKSEGMEPYAYAWERTHTAAQLQKQYIDLPDGVEADKEEDHVSVAGRIIARRTFGKLAFLTLRDGSTVVQVCFSTGDC
jgi:lysyl-tRNA synthetase class 2